MDAHSITVPVNGEDVRVDVPMRSFQGGGYKASGQGFAWKLTRITIGYYPNLLALYTFLGVQYREANFSYSFSRLAFGSKSRSTLALNPHLLYEGRSGLGGMGIPTSYSDAKSKTHFAKLLYTTTTTLPQLLSYFSYSLLLLCFFIRLNILCIPMFLET